MASNPPAKCCTVGVKHDFLPPQRRAHRHHLQDRPVRGLPRDAPAGVAQAQDTAILYLPDVISIWQNSKLMADQFAANGYLTLIIDLFNGDALSLNRSGDFDFMSWLTKGSTGDNPHTTEAVDPIVVEAIKYLKQEKGVKKIGAVGYCFGAKYVARHYPDITGPLSIAAAETDEIFPAEKRHRSEEILKEGGRPYQINLYSQTEHGFTVRCDVSKKEQKFAKEQAFLQAVTWFNHWLL
ncbi:hypothetical protein PG997_007102 [Apiospora hydei]|uniref:Dienelactone hydrolase domain-containing protein n=1 Tax=Apiospora hydei TaxID=1337664 RepID=A0ABR1WQM9_9PEZI